jgi:spoIIIJ-associated protein
VTEVVVEATGETVGEAKWAALRELERLRPGIDRNTVRFEVVSEGERGLLGVGYSPARVMAAVEAADAPDAGDTSVALPEDDPRWDDATRLRLFLERAAAAMGAECTVAVEEKGEFLVATLGGSDLGLLIGRHGQTIDALQYLANAIAHRRGAERRIVVDAAGYRSRRESALQAMAHRSVERAVATRRRVELEPMTAVERKVVHEFLKDDPEVETASEGSEPNRFVVIVPRRSAD